MTWNPLLLFPEGCTSNGTHLMKFKRGAFVGMRTVQPCYLKVSDRMVSPDYAQMDFGVLYTFIAASLCMYTCTFYVMPEFTPTKKMLEMHADKGSEDWEIFANCVREAMAKQGNFKLNNQPVKVKNEYENFVTGRIDEVQIEDKVFSYETQSIKLRKNNQ